MTSIEPFTPTFSSDQWEDLRSRIKNERAGPMRFGSRLGATSFNF